MALEAKTPEVSPKASFEELARTLIEQVTADQIFIYRASDFNGPLEPLLALGSLSLREKQTFWASQFDLSHPLATQHPDPPAVLDLSQERLSDAGSVIADLRTRALMVFPLTSHRRLLGLVLLGWLGDPTSVHLSQAQQTLANLLVRAMTLEMDNQRLSELHHLQNQEAHIAQQITQAILRRDDLAVILAFIANEGMRAVDALGCRISLFEEGQPPQPRLQPVLQVGQNFPAVPSLANWQETSPAQQEPFVQHVQSDALEEPGVILTIPLVSQQQTIGFLEIYQIEAYSRPKDLSSARSFANQAAVAVELARLSQRLQQSAVMEERARLARDLHDSISQSLYAMTLYTRAAQRQLSEGHLASVEKHLNELNSTSREVLGEMRLLIFELRPMPLPGIITGNIAPEMGGTPDMGEKRYALKDILEQRLQAVEARSGLEYDLEVQLSGELPALLEENLYYITLEALNNAIKHARATHVSVALKQTSQAVHLSIRDNGSGFDPAGERKGGLGLKGIQERVSMMSGRLEILTQAGAGVTVSIEVPFEQNSHSDR